MMATTPKRRVLFLMNRWLSTAGGIQTVNRKLACALANLDGALECVAVVMNASNEESEDAARHGVTLIRGDSDEDWASALLQKDLREFDPASVAAIVGHSHFSGRHALLLRDERFPSAVAVQFVHMSPMHSEHIKEYRQSQYVEERERRIALEFGLAKRADIVACVGPRLFRHMNHQLQAAQAKPRVLRIDCGFERAEGYRNAPAHPTVLCMGRADSVSVKGLDLFARAAGILTEEWLAHPSTDKRPIPEFVVRGAKDGAESLQAQLVELSTRKSGSSARIQVRPYTTGAEELRQELRAASVFVMPSREEGFGLVACEALSQGVPVVISSESGLAEAVREMSERSGLDVTECIVQHVASEEEYVSRYAKCILRALVKPESAEQRAHQMFEQLLVTNSWDAAAKTLRDALISHMPVISATPALVPAPPEPSPVGRPSTTPASASIPARGGATAEGTDEVAETLKRHEALFKSPGILTHVVRHAIVVFVEEGADVTLPEKLDNIDVVRRTTPKIRFSSIPLPRSGDGWIRLGGQGSARVGMWVTDQAENLLITTVAHALGPSPADAQVVIRSEPTSATFAASVVRWDPSADVALLAVPEASVTRSPVTLAEPALELPVRFILPGRLVTGVVSGVSATLRIEGRDGSQTLTDLFEVRIVEGALQSGDSGCLIMDADEHPVGFLVATTNETDTPMVQRAFAKSIIPAFAAMAVRPVAIELNLGSRDPQRTLARPPRVGILTDSMRTFEIVLQSLETVTREHRSTISIFTGRLGSDGPSVFVHRLESSGNLSAAVATTNFLRDYRVDGLILVGLAAGALSGVELGDVVVSSEIVHYEPAKLTEAGMDPRFRVVGLTPAWLTELARDPGDISRMEAGSGTTGSNDPARKLRVHVGPIASGEKVLQSARQLHTLLGNWRRVLAVEMEGAGVATAVSMSRTDAPFVIVRGIADLMDRGTHAAETDDWRDVAARNAVRLALTLARQFSSDSK